MHGQTKRIYVSVLDVSDSTGIFEVKTSLAFGLLIIIRLVKFTNVSRRGCNLELRVVSA